MSDRSSKGGSWIRPVTKCYGPRVVVSVIVEPWDVAPVIDGGHRVLSFGRVHVAESHRMRSGWSEIAYRVFDDTEAFWDYLETDLPSYRRIHVFTPNATQAVTLLGWWERLERCGAEHETARTKPKRKSGTAPKWRATPENVGNRPATPTPKRERKYWIRAIIDGATCAILRYRCNDRSFLWTSHNQYLSCTEHEIAQALNYSTPTAPGGKGAAGERTRSPYERCMMWARFLTGLSSWWERHHGGPWGPTVASCAMSFLRSRIQPETILHHGNDAVAALEEQAIFGGRRQVWYFGNVGAESDWTAFGKSPPSRSPYGELPAGMVHHDVRSMYPYLLSVLDFPVRLIAHKRSPSVESVIRTLDDYGAIATVLVRTTSPDYPLRTEAGVRWPIGEFVTTLAGPELSHALAAGRVLEIYSAAVYQLGRPFAAASDALLGLRRRYRESGDAAYEIFAKSLANAMSGKLAQREHVWTPRPGAVPKQLWGHWRSLDRETNRYREYRALAGVVWEKTLAESRTRQMGACYAYLTSAGRMLMRWVESMCPPRSVLAMDTDGVWTSLAAVESLYGDRPQTAQDAGELRVTIGTPCGRFFGPQHYWWGQAWVLSGMAVPEIVAGADKARVREIQTVYAQMNHTPEANVLERWKTVDLGRLQYSGRIDPAGWLVPPMVGPESLLERWREMASIHPDWDSIR